MIYIVLFLIGFRLFLPGAAAHITAGDAAELALSGVTLGVAHSPGYPVFSLWNKVGGSLLVFGNAAFRQNAMSALTMSLTMVLMGYLLKHWWARRWMVFLPLLLWCMPVFRHLAYVTEVFPLAGLWMVGAWILLDVCASRGKAGLAFLAFYLGLGVTIHQTLILALPSLVLLYRLRSPERNFSFLSAVPWMIIFFCVGASINLYLWVRSTASPVLDWEDPQTLERFWGVLTRARYGVMSLAQGGQSSLTWEALVSAFRHSRQLLFDQVGWTGASLLIIGTFGSLEEISRRRLMKALWTHIFFTGPFFFWMTGIAHTGNNDVLARFGLLPLLGAFLLLSMGIHHLWASEVSLYRWVMILLVSGFVVEAGVRHHFPFRKERLSAFALSQSEKGGTLRWDLSLRENGMNTLRMLPQKAVLFSDRADETEFSLAYLFGAEGRRPQMRFIDCNAGVTTSIYGDNYYKIWGRPRLVLRTRVENEIINKETDPVFYATLDPTMVDVYRTPRGLVFRGWGSSQIQRPIVFPWSLISTFRFRPREDRGTALMATNADILGRSQWELGFGDEAMRMFGVMQALGGTNRFEQMGYLFQVRQDRDRAAYFYDQAWARGVRTNSLISNGRLLGRDF